MKAAASRYGRTGRGRGRNVGEESEKRIGLSQTKEENVPTPAGRQRQSWTSYDYEDEERTD